MPRSSITFVDGVPQPRGAKPAHDERWMQATMYGRQLRLTKGIDPEERSRREQKRARELEELARTTPKKDIGRDEAIKQLRSASAIFQVGDSVIVNGHQAMVCEATRCTRSGPRMASTSTVMAFASNTAGATPADTAAAKSSSSRRTRSPHPTTLVAQAICAW